MNKKDIREDIRNVSLAMFRKNFLGIFHGSVSAKILQNRIIINTKNAIFDDLSNDKLIEINFKKDYRWEEASVDADIHFNIYNNIREAKFICHAFPPFISSYSLTHDLIIPKDYFGYKKYESVEIYDPKHYEDWYERANIEIPKALVKQETNILVVRGYGIYAYERDMFEVAKSIAILENSCRILHYAKQQGHIIN